MRQSTCVISDINNWQTINMSRDFWAIWGFKLIKFQRIDENIIICNPKSVFNE